MEHFDWTTFGNTILVDGFVASMLVILIFSSLFYIFFKFMERFMKSKHLDNQKSIANIIRGVLWIILILIIVSRFHIFSSIAQGIIASSGIIALIAGIAAQDTIGNLLSGIMVVASKPFIVGDLIKINGEQLIGFVEEITLRHTIICTYENNRIIVPNNQINQATIENATLVDSTKGNYFIIPIAYNSNIALATKIIEEECIAHPDFVDTRTPLEIANDTKAVTVRCIDFSQYALMLRCIVNSENSFKGFEMLSDLRFSIKKRFDEEGIEIPYNRTFVKKS